MTTDAVGGVWTYAIELVRALRAIDVRVTLACLGPAPRDHHYAALAALGDVELERHEGRLEWMDGCEDDLARAGEWLLALERRRAPDLVHLNGYAHAALPWRAPTLVVAHSCVSSWWCAVHKQPPPARYRGYRARVRAGLHRADAVVAPSAWMLQQILADAADPGGGSAGPAGPTGAGRLRGRVIPNGRQARERTPGPKGALILAAGRLWDPAKNLAVLDAAAAAVPWPVLVAGDERPPTAPQARASGHDSSGHDSSGQDSSPDWGEEASRRWPHVVTLGSLANEALAWWLAHASIFAHPARYEPFGLAPLEAGLAGCALVLGDIPSLREIWADAAVYVDPDDPAALAASLRALIRDGDRRRELARLARARAQRYSVARMLAGYHDLYRELTRPRRLPSPRPKPVRSCGS